MRERGKAVRPQGVASGEDVSCHAHFGAFHDLYLYSYSTTLPKNVRTSEATL